MSQPNPTPAWGTSIPPNAAAETQVMPPVQQVQPQQAQRPTREMVELRVTALHYASRMLGERGTTDPDTHAATTLRVSKRLEQYLLSGNVG